MQKLQLQRREKQNCKHIYRRTLVTWFHGSFRLGKFSTLKISNTRHLFPRNNQFKPVSAMSNKLREKALKNLETLSYIMTSKTKQTTKVDHLRFCSVFDV